MFYKDLGLFLENEEIDNEIEIQQYDDGTIDPEDVADPVFSEEEIFDVDAEPVIVDGDILDEDDEMYDDPLNPEAVDDSILEEDDDMYDDPLNPEAVDETILEEDDDMYDDPLNPEAVDETILEEEIFDVDADPEIMDGDSILEEDEEIPDPLDSGVVRDDDMLDEDDDLIDDIEGEIEVVDPVSISESNARLFKRGGKYLLFESDLQAVFNYYGGRYNGHKILSKIAESHNISPKKIVVLISESEVKHPSVKINKAVSRKRR